MLSSFISYIPKGNRRRTKNISATKAHFSGSGSARGWDNRVPQSYNSQVVLDIVDDRREPNSPLDFIQDPVTSPKIDIELPSERLDVDWPPHDDSQADPFTLMLEGAEAERLGEERGLRRWGQDEQALDESKYSSLNLSERNVLQAYLQQGDTETPLRHHASSSSLRPPSDKSKRRSRASALSDNDVSMYSLEYVTFDQSAEDSPDSMRPRTPTEENASTLLPYAMSARKAAPAPIKIPNAALYGPKVQLLPSEVDQQRAQSRPESMESSAEPSSALSSGTSIARALFANTFVFSNQTSRYRSGVSIVARQDSATLPRGEHPFVYSPLTRDRKINGDISSPAPSDGDAHSRRGPRLRRAVSAKANNRHSTFRHPTELALLDSPTLAGLDLSPARRISRISEATSSIPSTPESIKPPQEGSAPSTSNGQPSPLAASSSLGPPPIPARSQERLSPHPQVENLFAPSPGISPNATPLSQGEFSEPGSGREIDNVLDYYQFDAEENINLQPKRRMPFSPISEESSSWLSPASSQQPGSGRSDGMASRQSSRPSSPPQVAIGQRSPPRIDFAARRTPGGSPRMPSLAGPRQSLLPIGERPRSIQIGHVIVSPLSPGSSLGSSRLGTATTASSLASPEDGEPLLPPTRGIFNRQRSGSAPSPIKVVPRADYKAFNISVSPMTDMTASTPSSGGTDEVPVQQTFPETPSAFSPTWTMNVGSPAMPGERTHEYPVLMPGTPAGGRSAQPSLAQQVLLTRAATTVRSARHTRQPSQPRGLLPPPPNGRPHSLLLTSDGNVPLAAKSAPLPASTPEPVPEEAEGGVPDEPADFPVDETVVIRPSVGDHASRLSPHNSPASSRDRPLPRARSVSPSPSRHTPSPRHEGFASLAPSRAPSRASSTRSFASGNPPPPLSLSHSSAASSPVRAYSAASRSTPDLVPSATRVSPPVPVDVSPTDTFASPSFESATTGSIPSASSSPYQALSMQAMGARSPNALFADAFPSSNGVSPSSFNSATSPNYRLGHPGPSFSTDLDIDVGHQLSASFVAPPAYHTIMDHQQEGTRSPLPSDYGFGSSQTHTPSTANSNMNGAPDADPRTPPSAGRRPRMRPPLPTGPRRPPQFAPGSSRDDGRQRNASAPTLLSNHLPSGSGRRQHSLSSSPKFRTPPSQWRGFTLEAAKWTFTSSELQAIVSRAIRQSAEASSFRLLRLETLEHDIKDEMERLKTSRADIKTRYVLLTRKRGSLLDSLTAYLSNMPQDQSTTLHLVDELADISTTLDRLAEELDSVDEQIMQLTSLCDNHSASALAMALRKLNTSFLKQVGENQALRSQVEALEAERDEAWKQAQEVANDYDHLHGQVESAVPDSAGGAPRSSRVMAVRKSSLRVSKAGLRSASFRRSQRSSISSNGQRSSVISPASATSPPGIVPPVPPIPKPRPLDIVTDLPTRSSTGIWSNGVTPTSETRALAKAQEELYDMLGISVHDHNFVRRSHSVAERRLETDPAANATGSDVQRHSNATSTGASSLGRRSSLPNNPSVVYDAMAADRKAMLTTLDILSDD
ncbi:hypothetical protein HGRIS_012448 [Hohenbuehelia grisea]|uniref:Uncharacterized protein n=1 Tax=Hohenbuehelia grisea TaxID=104357 RepID=A0ABR3ISA7_9AGAR